MKTNTTNNKRNFAPVPVWNGQEVYFIEDTPKQYSKPLLIPDFETWQKETAMKASISVLKQIFYSTNDNKVGEMYHGLINDQKSINNPAILNYTVSDGYDVFIECYLYLKAMNANGYYDLYTPDTIEITLSKGKKKKASLFQGICYKARNYIYKYGQIDFKRVYIEDLTRENKEGEKLNSYDALEGLIKVSQYYDIENERDYTVFKIVQKNLNLTTRQKQILHYRNKGLSVSEIAEKLNVSQQAISKQLAKIQNEITVKYPDMVRHFRGKRKSAKAQ